MKTKIYRGVTAATRKLARAFISTNAELAKVEAEQIARSVDGTVMVVDAIQLERRDGSKWWTGRISIDYSKQTMRLVVFRWNGRMRIYDIKSPEELGRRLQLSGVTLA